MRLANVAASYASLKPLHVCVQLARLLQDSTRGSCIALRRMSAPCDGTAFAQLHDRLVLQRRRAIGGFVASALGAVGRKTSICLITTAFRASFTRTTTRMPKSAPRSSASLGKASTPRESWHRGGHGGVLAFPRPPLLRKVNFYDLGRSLCEKLMANPLYVHVVRVEGQARELGSKVRCRSGGGGGAVADR